MPAGTAFRAATAGRGHCTAPHTGARRATVQRHLATLKAGAAWRARITVTIKASTGTLRDQANITSVTPGPRTGSNTATATTKITTKIHQVDPPPASGPGPGPGPGLRIT